MPVIRAIIITVVLAACTSCTHTVIRENYRFEPGRSSGAPVAIKKNTGSLDSLVKVGEISLTDGWWVLICNEREALSLLKKEAHQLRADLVHISGEKRPDIQSSCYRCEASFYHYRYPGMAMNSDSAYTEEAIQVRHKKDNKRKTLLAGGSIVLGLTIGVLIGLAYF